MRARQEISPVMWANQQLIFLDEDMLRNLRLSASFSLPLECPGTANFIVMGVGAIIFIGGGGLGR